MAENFDLHQEYTGELINIIVKVPENTVACRVTAKMMEDGKLIEANMDMSPEEFRQARQDFCDNVEDGDDFDKMYTLTEEGKAYVEKLMGADK